MMNKSIAVIDGHPISEKDFMSAVDNELILLNDTGDINHVMATINMLDRLDNVTGHAKAKLLWGTNEWWLSNKPNENFSEHVESTTSTKKVTVERYINVWKHICDYTIPRKIHSFPMRDLVPIANMLSQGYEPSKEQWNEIQLASNNSEILDVIRTVKGKKPRKSGMKIYLEKDGSLNVWRNNVKSYVGFLDLAESNPDVAKAIERIVSGAQIIRR